MRTEHTDEIGTNPLNAKVIDNPKKDNFMLTRDPGELSGEPRFKLSMAKGKLTFPLHVGQVHKGDAERII
jgi:hypothetical protein